MVFGTMKLIRETITNAQNVKKLVEEEKANETNSRRVARSELNYENRAMTAPGNIKSTTFAC
jgi:hypothetical protein